MNGPPFGLVRSMLCVCAWRLICFSRSEVRCRKVHIVTSFYAICRARPRTHIRARAGGQSPGLALL